MLWQFILIALLGALGVLVASVLVESLLVWNERRRFGDECTTYHRCPECRAEPPSRLDRWDRP